MSNQPQAHVADERADYEKWEAFPTFFDGGEIRVGGKVRYVGQYQTLRMMALDHNHSHAARAAIPAGANVASIAPMAPHGTLLPAGDEFVRLMSVWRMADVGDKSRVAFDAVVAHINAWGARRATGAPAVDVLPAPVKGL